MNILNILNKTNNVVLSTAILGVTWLVDAVFINILFANIFNSALSAVVSYTLAATFTALRYNIHKAICEGDGNIRFQLCRVMLFGFSFIGSVALLGAGIFDSNIEQAIAAEKQRIDNYAVAEQKIVAKEYFLDKGLIKSQQKEAMNALDKRFEIIYAPVKQSIKHQESKKYKRGAFAGSSEGPVMKKLRQKLVNLHQQHDIQAQAIREKHSALLTPYTNSRNAKTSQLKMRQANAILKITPEKLSGTTEASNIQVTSLQRILHEFSLDISSPMVTALLSLFVALLIEMCTAVCAYFSVKLSSKPTHVTTTNQSA